jgi:hypothetical protein
VKSSLHAFAIFLYGSFHFSTIVRKTFMAKNTGLFTYHLHPLVHGTSRAVPLRHAAFVRPCARSLRGEEQGGGASERDVEIVAGPSGPVIPIHK